MCQDLGFGSRALGLRGSHGAGIVVWVFLGLRGVEEFCTGSQGVYKGSTQVCYLIRMRFFIGLCKGSVKACLGRSAKQILGLQFDL